MQVHKCVTSILFSLVLALAQSRIIIEDVQESDIIILLNKHGHKESVSQQIYVDSGENFTLTCATVHSYANDEVSLRWFKTKKVLLREGEYLVKEEPMESSNPLTLSFSPVDISDAGSYMCKHLHSNMQRSVYIKVNTPRSGDASVNVVISKVSEDGVEENAPENLEVWEGNRFTLKCKANNKLPALSKLNLISSTENGEGVFKESSINNNELKFDPVRLTDTGIYSCSDNHGNESKTVHITVKPHLEQGFLQNLDYAEEQDEKKKHAQFRPELSPFLASRFEALQDFDDANKLKHLKPVEHEKPNNRITFNDEEEKPKNQKNFENEDNSNRKHVDKQVDILPEKYSHEKNEKQSQQGIFGKPHDEIKDRSTEIFNKDLNPKRLPHGVIEKLHEFKPGGLEGDVNHKLHDERSDVQRDKIYVTEDKMAGHGGPRKEDREKPFLNIIQKTEENDNYVDIYTNEKNKHAQFRPEVSPFLASRFEALQDLDDANKLKHLKPAEHQKPNNRISFNDEKEKPKNQKNFENGFKYNSNNKHIDKQVDILPEKYSHGKNEKQSQQALFGKPHNEIKDRLNEFFNKDLNPKRILHGATEKFHKFKPGGLEGDVNHKQHDERRDIQRDKIYETEYKMAGRGDSRKDDREKPFLNVIPKTEKKTLNKFEAPAALNIDGNNRQHMFDNVKPYVADSVQKFLDAFENFKNKNNLAALENRGKFPKQYSENGLNSEKMDHLENRFGNENIPSEVFFPEGEDNNIQKIDAGKLNEGVDHEIKNQLNELEEEFNELDDVVEIEDLISKILTTFDEELSDVTEISKIPEWASINDDKNQIKNDIKHLLQEFKELKDLVKFEKFLSTILHELEKDSDWISFAHDKQEALNELLDNLKPERLNGKNKNMTPLSEKFDVPKDDLEKNGWRLADRFNDLPREGIFDDSNEFMQADEGISENQIPKSKEEIHDTSKHEQESKKDIKMDIVDLHNKLTELEHLKEIDNVQNEILEKLDEYGSTENKPADNGQNIGELPNKIAFKPNSHNDVAESRDEFNEGTFFDNPTGRKLKVYSEFLKELRDCLEEELSIPKDAGVNEKERPSGEEWDNEGGEINQKNNLDEEVENIPIEIRPRLGESDDLDFGDDYGRWHHEQENVRDWKEKPQTIPGNSQTRMSSRFRDDIYIDQEENDDDNEQTKYEHYDLEEREGSGQEDMYYDIEKGDINSADEMKQDWAERHTSQEENPAEQLNDTTHSTLIIAGLSIAISILSFALILRTWCLTECKKRKSGADVDDESKYTLLP